MWYRECRRHISRKKRINDSFVRRMQLLYGKPVADRIHTEIRERVNRLSIQPKLAVILVGDDPASHLYVSLKEKEAGADGIAFEKHLFASNVGEDEVVSMVARLNDDTSVHGILIQLPLPKGFNVDHIVKSIDPEKDADGFHARNISAFLAGDVSRIPVFPEALIELLLSSEQPLKGQSAFLVVNSEHFGRVMLKACESQGLVGRIIPSERLLAEAEMTLEARVIVSACGVPNLIRRVNILPNAIIIDGGIVKDETGRTVGDVDGEGIAGETGFLSPVPGGVGPITIACLLRRVVTLAEEKQKSRENMVSS